MRAVAVVDAVLSTAHPREEALSQVVRYTVRAAIALTMIDNIVLISLAKTIVRDVFIRINDRAGLNIFTNKLGEFNREVHRG